MRVKYPKCAYGPYGIKYDLKWCIHLSRSLFLYYRTNISLLWKKWMKKNLPPLLFRQAGLQIPDNTTCGPFHYYIKIPTFPSFNSQRRYFCRFEYRSKMHCFECTNIQWRHYFRDYTESQNSSFQWMWE